MQCSKPGRRGKPRPAWPDFPARAFFTTLATSSHDFECPPLTQHEYVFVTLSIILGLSITRLLSEVGGLIRAHRRIRFHWATALWASCVMVFILQMWWVGWELRNYPEWSFFDFFVLVACTVFIYGAAELALPVEDYDVASDKELDFLRHSESLGRVSAASMLGYFLLGPYVNISLFGNAALPSILVAGLGAALMLVFLLKPVWFKAVAVVFAAYAGVVLFLTA